MKNLQLLGLTDANAILKQVMSDQLKTTNNVFIIYYRVKIQIYKNLVLLKTWFLMKKAKL